MKLGLIGIGILVIIITIGGVMYLKSSENTDRIITKDQENESPSKVLSINPQEPNEKVIVESVTLSKNGFLVVRQMEGDKLSQIVEMSSFLPAGTHKNIVIPLGNVDVSDSDLIVMIYEDAENDQVFNDLDLPAINENGNMTAMYVKTGKPLASGITEGDSSGMPAHNMPGMKEMVKVRYTDKGFSPNEITIPVNSMVEFVNESSTDMWVASAEHPAHGVLPTFDQFRAYKQGGIYRYVFDKKGNWEFHDHINPARGGKVVVN